VTRFPSAEWARIFEGSLNENAAYEEAAQAWEGEIFLLILPDATAAHGEGVFLDLYHGKCRSARFVADATGVTAEFVFEGTRENWARVFHHELDPINALLSGTFKIRGNLAKAMRFTRAAKELVDTAAAVPTDV